MSKLPLNSGWIVFVLTTVGICQSGLLFGLVFIKPPAAIEKTLRLSRSYLPAPEAERGRKQENLEYLYYFLYLHDLELGKSQFHVKVLHWQNSRKLSHLHELYWFSYFEIKK